MKKIISLLTTVVLLITTMTTGLCAQAAVENGESEIMPCYTYVSDHKAILKLNGTTATCQSYVNGYSSTTKITMKMTLQKKTVLWWSEVTSWSTTVNGTTAALNKTKSLDSGTYRIKMTATVYSGSNSEEVTTYSAQVKVSQLHTYQDYLPKQLM